MSKRLRIKPVSDLVVAKDRIVFASTRKVNAVAKMIRGLKVDKAVDALTFCKRGPAKAVKKVLIAAICNAVNNNGLNADALVVKEAYVGKSVVLRRYMPRAKGSGSPIRKEFSRLTVVLCEVGE